MRAPVFTVLLLIFFYYKKAIASNTNFKVKRFEICSSTQGLIKFNGNITTESDGEYMTGTLLTTIPWDDNFSGTCLIENKIGNIYIELFTIRERNICKAFNIYMGEFWYDLERAAQIPIGVCPVREGKYQVHHAKLNFYKISLQTFPFGTLRFTLKGYDKKNPKTTLICLLMEVENIIN